MFFSTNLSLIRLINYYFTRFFVVLFIMDYSDSVLV